ncbi:MAG: chorismate lyase [Gammaproteobacteria bacterium]|nr:chorismate lyase [Gammaproteobacteria bacterium]NND53757.1 chorismate lyase [Gammaproteobacteria bacterium]
MAASGQQLSDTGNRFASRWLAEPRCAELTPDTLIASWLTETGLLTRRLRTLCGDDFNMQVLRNAEGDDVIGLHREVLLCCGPAPCIYAVTDVPAATLREHDWLAQLGDEPLGETLQSRADVTRSSFSYALLQPESLPAAAKATTPAWARRSAFQIGAATLSVTEVFLAALNDCG